MEEIINHFLTSWTPSTLPTSTSISSINPTNIPGLSATAESLRQEVATQTNSISLYFLSRNARAAAASYTILSDQQVLASATSLLNAAANTGGATPTLDVDLAQITQELFNSTLLLKKLEWEANLYAIHISVPFNLLFAILFSILLLVNFYLGLIRGKTRYFATCMLCGCGLEIAGYVARTIGHFHWSNTNIFLCQIICLTIAPAFVMAGVYYLLTQLIIIHGGGRRFSILRPSYISWIFICCDVISLFIQAAGGITAAVKLRLFENTQSGTYIMVGGIAFQVVSMTLYLALLFNFLYHIYFKSIGLKFSFGTLWHLLLNTKRGHKIRIDYNYDSHYDPSFQRIRQRPLFNYLPLAIIMASLFVYVRCIYRVIELSEGWRGYLITHEAYILTLDALMVFLSCVTFLPFHPVIVFGKDVHISIRESFGKVNMDLPPVAISEKEHSFSNDDQSSDTLQEKYMYGQSKSSDRVSSTPTLGNNGGQKYHNPYLSPTRFANYKSSSSKYV
ncbi:RSB1 [Candida theae]|uniref:Sphingoid long-chain base transporter RSB1 n=1 Tax=Candida theae TaxID=1198502 RepID=A0AAD5BES0_9ASCO|nr:RSB1 [Candida theae]KAI5958101.1 RSB1 [Candida theae]